MAERQTAPTLAEIRGDHVARYRWAASRLGEMLPASRRWVGDAGCGCGYGSALLADAGFRVIAWDRSPEALDYAAENWARRAGVWHYRQDAAFAPRVDAVVAFEILEHLEDPAAALLAWRREALVLLASVPNEAALPFDPRRFPFHRRHYAPAAFEVLLAAGGWRVTARRCQRDAHRGEVVDGTDGRTLVFEAERDE